MRPFTCSSALANHLRASDLCESCIKDLAMKAVEQTTRLGATQISRRMPVRALSGRKRGVSLKAVHAYLKSTEMPSSI